jgi:monovalent cation:H+ antiporter-2, CPA2 family
LLRGYFHGTDDDTADEQENIRLSSVTLSKSDHAVGVQLALVAASLKEVQVISLKRNNGQQITVDEAGKSDDLNRPLEIGDTLVLSGKPEALDLAEKKLVNG